VQLDRNEFASAIEGLTLGDAQVSFTIRSSLLAGLASPMKHHGINPTPECPLYSEVVADFAALEQVSLPSAHTVLLIVSDSSGVSSDTVNRVAQRLLASGLIYICIWGPDCERVHDIFDWANLGDGNREPDFTLMSTWHSAEPLEEAIWFFTYCAFPLDTEIETTSYLAIIVGNPDWAGTVDCALSDLPAFSARLRDN